MGNNGTCDVCAGNARSQMDMRRQKAAMYDSRYARNQMMPGMQQACEANCNSCEVRQGNNCDSCGMRDARNLDTCSGMAAGNQDNCSSARTMGNQNACSSARTVNGCDACSGARTTGSQDIYNGMRTMNSGACTGARSRDNDDCINPMRDELRGMPLAMGYVPWQNFGCTYEPMEGLRAGTIFPELEKPFYGGRNENGRRGKR